MQSPTSDTNQKRIFSLSFPELWFTQFPLYRVYQPIYERYSKLKLTRETDRALAFQNIEFRISQIFIVIGKFGLFFDSSELCRSLLWRREGTETSLKRIDYQGFQSPPPTWSWAAYKGAIGYFDLPTDGIIWGNVQHANVRNSHVAVDSILIAETYHYDTSQLSDILYDCIDNEKRAFKRCVVLGKSKVNEGMANGTAYYLLIVGTKGPNKDGDVTWERLGVAYSEDPNLFSNKETERVSIS